MYRKWNSIEDRFWSKVNITNTCWLWTGSTKGNGYGQFMVKVEGKWKPVFAHRFAYTLAFGPIPVGKHLDHLCGVTLCVNPYHLEPVTPRENNHRMELEVNSLGQFMARGSSDFQKDRRNRCWKGHEFTDESTYTRPDGTRADESGNQEGEEGTPEAG